MIDVAKALLFTLLMTLAGASHSAIDIPVEARESHLKFRHGRELSVKSDGEHLISLQLQFGGVSRTLSGAVFEGIEQPDLTTIKLKLVAADQCKSEAGQCFDYSLPMVEISVGRIPEDKECPYDCLVHFLFEGGAVVRSTRSGKGSETVYHPPQTYSVTSN